jgi:hypothetical protein
VTTLLSLATRDFIVVGCDSLATTTAYLTFSPQITNEFFDQKGQLKIGSDGKPVLKEAGQIWQMAHELPINQLPSVTKLYDLKPVNACLLFSGASNIGETTIRNLVETFKSDPKFVALSDSWTIENLSLLLRDFVLEVYEREIPVESQRPLMEIIISGYSSEHREPEVWRLTFYYLVKFNCDAKA